jgi:6-pyruvoyltetrahydropterin/6-carboxytetrahydropterin synthase
MLITRRAEFSASHVCLNPELTAEQNQALYGAEANPRGHGHNFIVEVTLAGEADPVTGMVYDIKKLKSILQREVVEPFDHRFLNLEVAPFDRVVPTPENIALEIWRRLQPHFAEAAVQLHAVRVFETEDLYVDYFGASA